MKTYFWSDGSGRLEIPLTQAQIDSVCHPGPNDAAVAAIEKPQLNPETVRTALREYGAWNSEELADHAANMERIFWVACWDCFDNPEFFIEEAAE